MELKEAAAILRRQNDFRNNRTNISAKPGELKEAVETMKKHCKYALK